MQQGMTRILEPRGIPHSFTGHPSMGGLFFRETPPENYRDWKTSDYSFYDTLAANLIARGVMCEPDSREPWFISSAHDKSCLDDTLRIFEEAVRSEEHTSELQSLMRISYAVFCLNKKRKSV